MQSKNVILVPTDFSPKSILALDQAIFLAAKSNFEIMLLYVIHSDNKTFGFISDLFTPEENESIRQRVEQQIWAKLDALIDSKKESGVVIKAMISKGKAYDKITEVSESIGAQYVVIGSNSAEIDEKKGFLGSNTSRIVRSAKVPTIVISSKISKEIKTIILPLDLTKQTQQKVAKAIQFARIHNAQIKVVSALTTNDPAVIKQLTVQINNVTKFISEHYNNCTAEFVSGDGKTDTPASMIMKYAEENHGDIVMIMTQQETKLMHLFIGTTAMDIVFNSNIPVFSITPKELNSTSYR